YSQVPEGVAITLSAYTDRASALGSSGFTNRSLYWAAVGGTPTYADLSGYGDGPTYRAYPARESLTPEAGSVSGITFVDGNIVAYVTVSGFNTTDDADAFA